MWLTYSYDLGSINKYHSEIFEIEIPESLVLNYSSILQLLKDHFAYVEDSTILSYLREDTDSYEKITPQTTFQNTPENTLEILIRNSEMSEYLYLYDQVESLRYSITDLEKQIGDQEDEESKLSQVNEEIDIALLYAAPLVRDGIRGLKSCDTYNINISKEKEHLLNEFRNNNINAEVRFEVATLKNLRMIMNYKPKIIHISCHGYYLKGVSDFVLAFESSEIIGLTEEVSQKSLRNVFKSFPNYPGIFMISACYSQAIAAVLKEAGIKYFVVVHKECKVHDNAAIDFTVKFYKKLLFGEEIKKSFEDAKKHLKNLEMDVEEVCCCTHKHSDNCPLKSFNKSIHELHLPGKELCDCDKRKNIYRHKISCKWAKKFLNDFNIKREPNSIEEKTGKWVICCCHEKEIPHDEYEKFVLEENTNEKNFRLFNGYEVRENKDFKMFDQLLKPEPVIEGNLCRAKEIYNILSKLSGKNRVLMIYGEEDVGKTYLIKYVAQYGYDRKLFKNGVIYVDMKKKQYAKNAMQCIADKLSCLDYHPESLQKILESLQIFIIIDNTDLMNDNELNELCNRITDLHDYTSYVKFCIINRNNIKKPLFEEYCLNKIDQGAVGVKLKSMLNTEFYQSNRDYIKNILHVIDMNAPNVANIIDMFKNKRMIEIKELCVSKPIQNPSENQLYHNFISNLNARNPESLVLIKLLSEFPSGVYNSEIPKICARTSLNIENIKNSLINKHSYIIEIDSPIFQVPIVLKNLLCAIDTPLFNYGEYLRKLSRSIYFECLNKSKDAPILKTYTSLFFTDIEFSNTEDRKKNYPDTTDDPFTVFEEMLPNFTAYIITLKDNYSNEHNIGQCIYEICLYCARVFLLLNNIKDLMSKIDESISHLNHLLRKNVIKHKEPTKKLKLFRESVAYEIPDSFNKQNSLINLKHYFDMNKNIDQNPYGEVLLLIALIDIKRQNTTQVSSFFQLAEDYFDSNSLKIGKSRTLLAKVSWLLENEPTHESIPVYLKTAKKVFKQIEAHRLYEESIFLMGRHYFNKESWLNCEKCWNKGLELANKLQDRELEIKYKEKLTETYTHIRRRSQNVISILRSYPVICQDSSYKDINESVFCTHFTSFKEDLVNTLIKDNKIICLKFEIGTRENLIQQIEQGCRVLQISSVIPHKNNLILENDDYSADVLSMDTLKSLLEDKLQAHGIDLLVLAIPFSYELAEFFHKTLKVPNVICFDFEQFPQIKYLTQLQKMFEQAVEKFCINFYHYLIEGNIISLAWEKSKKIVDTFIQENSTLFEHLKVEDQPIRTYKGKGPYLFSSGASALFTDSRNDVLTYESNLKIGKPINMSSLKPPTNIDRKSNSFVSRHKTMHEILKILKNDEIVHVTGEQGIGKTKLIQHIGVYLNGRGLYTQGTYYESFKGMPPLEKVKEIAKLYEGDGKNDLLLIIDDCEQLIRELPGSFINMIERIQKKPNNRAVHLIISSLPCMFNFKCRRVELKPLDPLESAGLFMAVYGKNLKRCEIPHNKNEMNIAENLTQIRIIKECMNIPSKIISLVEKLKDKNFYQLEQERNEHNPMMRRDTTDLDTLELFYSESMSNEKNDIVEEEKENVGFTPKPKSKGDLIKKPEPKKKKR